MSGVKLWIAVDNEKGCGVKGAWLNRAIFSGLKTLLGGIFTPDRAKNKIIFVFFLFSFFILFIVNNIYI